MVDVVGTGAQMVDIGCDTHMQLCHDGLGIGDVDGGYKLLL